MVFLNISHAEKEAFFALLDEYFESRPNHASSTNPRGVASGGLAESLGPAGAVTVAKLSSASNVLKSSLNSHTSPHKPSSPPPPTPPAGRPPPARTSDDTPSEGAGGIDTTRSSFTQLRQSFNTAQAGAGAANNILGAAKGRFGGLNKAPPPPPASRIRSPNIVPERSPSPPVLNAPPPPPAPPAPAPPPAPKRTPSAITTSSAGSGSPGGVAGLKSSSKIGNIDIDVSSKGTAMGSITSKLTDRVSSAIGRTPSTSSKAPGISIPAALPQTKHSFAPPPVRRVGNDHTPNATPPPIAPKKMRTPSPEPAPEPEVEGDWADAIYDYTSDDKTDLRFSAGDRLLVIDRTSDDWWTGELDGKQGLFPASYVKLL